MKRILFMAYSIFCYLFFFASFSYLMGFTANLVVPKGIDGPLMVPMWEAVLTNLLLITLFGAQHSIMARAWFKDWWTQFVPKPIERSTFVLFSSLALVLLFYFWQPMGGVIWSVKNPVLLAVIWSAFTVGYGLVFWSSFQINHGDLFGLRQAGLHFLGRAYEPLSFKVPFLYRMVRHPLYFGVLLAFWSAPVMSYTRLLFALVFTLYVLRAIDWEEKDLIRAFGDTYRHYSAKVPKILPRLFRPKSLEPAYKTIRKKD